MLAISSRLAVLPVLDAVLNATSAVLLVSGHSFIRRGRLAAHRMCMVAAVFTSTLFLISYLYYHSRAGIVRFRGVGSIRPFYFVLLTSHTILAASLLILVPVTLGFALTGRFERHKPVARWTYPIWLYVSLTGVLIYFMVYRWY